MSASKDINLVEKLNDSNYSNWVFKMENLLLKDDLSNIFIIPKPDPVMIEWNKQNAKTKAILNLTVDDNQIIQIKHLENDKDIWEALKAVLQRSGLSSKLFLLRKLYSKKYAKMVT